MEGASILQKDQARTQGTSVFIEGLLEVWSFDEDEKQPLPVRRRVFEKACRNQLTAAVSCIQVCSLYVQNAQQYALCCPFCRICVTNTPKGGRKQDFLNVSVCCVRVSDEVGLQDARRSSVSNLWKGFHEKCQEVHVSRRVQRGWQYVRQRDW